MPQYCTVQCAGSTYRGSASGRMPAWCMPPTHERVRLPVPPMPSLVDTPGLVSDAPSGLLSNAPSRRSDAPPSFVLRDLTDQLSHYALARCNMFMDYAVCGKPGGVSLESLRHAHLAWHILNLICHQRSTPYQHWRTPGR